MPKRDFTALKSRETISKKEEKRDPLKLLKFLWLSLMSPKIVVKNPKQWSGSHVHKVQTNAEKERKVIAFL